MRKLGALILLLPTVVFAIQPSEIDTAIAIGSCYKTEMEYVADISSQNTICKKEFCYLFFSDFEIIAGAAARATQEMKQFTKSDVESLPLRGLTKVYVSVGKSVTGGLIGAIRDRNFVQHWAGGNVHMVLKIGDQIMQPVSSSLNGVLGPTLTLPIYAFWEAPPDPSLLAAGPLHTSDLQAYFEFSYDLTPEQQSSVCEIILINGQAKKHVDRIDLSQVLHVKPHVAENPTLFEFQNGQSMCLDLIKQTEEQYLMKDARGIVKKVPLHEVKTTRMNAHNPCNIQTSTVGGESPF
jgi:hypothetical protein